MPVRKPYALPSLQPLCKRGGETDIIDRFIKSLGFNPLAGLNIFNQTLKMWEQRFLNISVFYPENLYHRKSQIFQPQLELFYRYSTERPDNFKSLLELSLRLDILSCQILGRLYKKMKMLGLSDCKVKNAKVWRIAFYIKSSEGGVQTTPHTLFLNLFGFLYQKGFTRDPISYLVNEVVYAHELGHALLWGALEDFWKIYDESSVKKLEETYGRKEVLGVSSEIVAQWFAIQFAGEEKTRMHHERLAKTVKRDNFPRIAYILAVANEMGWKTKNIEQLRSHVRQQKDLQKLIQGLQYLFANLKFRVS
ncbi:hypothetical protein AMJ44_12720 [candidate division WOR-1 bacterium DG_54_3]|uniref:Uncharacterized protein n=1 Tax=candidate division WOR-1 bacterium DG_54_3 TaxID=1703775 RepID=A0A0S7XQE5_UNCSA|nr:MAG: hypothetical protein AMJ44_12720 [candidate division WOR-1 bacterium DG_54_3]